MPRWLSRILPNVDIEGERLREHREAVDWARECGLDAITADALVAGGAGASVGPLDLRIAAGTLVIASGTATDRKLLAATLAGRLDPLSGRVQVGGHPLPSESGYVNRLVALEDVGGSDRAEVRSSIGELLIERLRLTQPWYRIWSSGRRARVWLDRANAILAGAIAITPDTALDRLPQLERAVALAAVAFAEHTPVVMLDLLDAFGDPADEVAFLCAIDRLAPAETTIVVGTPAATRLFEHGSVGRAVATIDLYASASHESDRRGARS
jgi:RND superfamily putative drug exporter